MQIIPYVLQTQECAAARQLHLPTTIFCVANKFQLFFSQLLSESMKLQDVFLKDCYNRNYDYTEFLYNKLITVVTLTTCISYAVLMQLQFELQKGGAHFFLRRYFAALTTQQSLCLYLVKLSIGFLVICKAHTALLFLSECYAGNEADVTLYVNNTGLMWENAAVFNALLIFAEHRYYGNLLCVCVLGWLMADWVVYVRVFFL
jgi:hypothetical protein